MAGNNLSRSLVIAFIVVMLAYFFVWFYATSQLSYEAVGEVELGKREGFKSMDVTVVVEQERVVPRTNKVLVHNKHVGVIDKDGSVVAISANGQAHNVVNGVVLADGMVISASSDHYSVYRVNDPEKSSSSNYEPNVVPFP